MKNFYGAVLMLACAAAFAAPHNVEIRTLSNRADLISGGDALVEVVLPQSLKPKNLELRLNGRDVSSQFQYIAAEHRLVALLGSLAEGANELVADANGRGKGRPYASLEITNHSRGGPVFSGPQMQPWICATVTSREVTVTVPGTSSAGTGDDARERARCRPGRRQVQRAEQVHLLLPAQGERRQRLHLHHRRRGPLLRALQPGDAAGARRHRQLHQRPRRHGQEHRARRARHA